MSAPALAGLFLLAALSAASAVEDPLHVWTGLDVDRHVWMKSDHCTREPLSEAVPGLQGPLGSCDRLSPSPDTSRLAASLTTRYRNLAHRDGLPGYAHDETASILEVRLRLLRSLEWHSLSEGFNAHRSYKDSSLRFAGSPNVPAWTLRNSLAYTGFPSVVPFIAAGIGTEGLRELAFGGRARVAGLTLSIAGGWKNLDYPLVLDLPEYRPLTLPLVLRQTFQAAALEGRFRNFDLFVMSRFNQTSHPETWPEPYSYSDSGSSAEYFAGASWTDSGTIGRYHLSLQGERYEGRRVFRGMTSGPEGEGQFAFQETRQQSAWLRGDARVSRGENPGGHETGLFAGYGAVRWEALRPGIAAGHYFWERNAVLESYEGSLLDIFSQQTYLFDGRAVLEQFTTGAWTAFPVGLSRLRLGLSWHRIDLEAYGRLTQKTTTLIIAYTERDFLFNFYGVEADLLVPEVAVSRRFGKAVAEASLQQALPLDIRMRHANGSGGSSRNGGGSSSGGTEAALRIRWEVL